MEFVQQRVDISAVSRLEPALDTSTFSVDIARAVSRETLRFPGDSTLAPASAQERRAAPFA